MKKSLISLALVLAVLAPLAVLAQTDSPAAGGTTVLPNPLGEAVTPAELAARVINILLGVVGIAALIIFIYGGVQYMFSGGNSQKVQSAKNTIVYATLGIAIILASRSLLQFIMKAVVGATGTR
jgi:hypothetical protein